MTHRGVSREGGPFFSRHGYAGVSPRFFGVLRARMTPQIVSADMMLNTLRNEPIENRLPNDPIEPTLSADPIDPIDSTEFLQPMHKKEFSDAMLQRAVRSRVRIFRSPFTVNLQPFTLLTLHLAQNGLTRLCAIRQPDVFPLRRLA